MEHQFGRASIDKMAEAATAYAGGDSSAEAIWADAAVGCVALLREHIAKENEILFVMAERLLSPEEQTRLFAEFGGVDKNKMGKAKLSRSCNQPGLTAESTRVVPS